VSLGTGDVILVRNTGPISGLIRFGERVRYAGWWASLGRVAQSLTGTAPPDRPQDPWYVNHAAVYVNGALIEAGPKGLVRSPANKYDGKPIVIARLSDVRPDASAVEIDALASFAIEQLNRHDKYDWLSILSIVLEIVTPARLDISWDGALICSAFAAQCWEHAGVTLPTRSSLTTTPADLRAFAEKGWRSGLA